jgi:hypothetical protein
MAVDGFANPPAVESTPIVSAGTSAAMLALSSGNRPTSRL